MNFVYPPLQYFRQGAGLVEKTVAPPKKKHGNGGGHHGPGGPGGPPTGPPH